MGPESGQGETSDAGQAYGALSSSPHFFVLLEVLTLRFPACQVA